MFSNFAAATAAPPLRHMRVRATLSSGGYKVIETSSCVLYDYKLYNQK